LFSETKSSNCCIRWCLCLISKVNGTDFRRLWGL